MFTNRIPHLSESAPPVSVLLLRRLSAVSHSGTEVLDAFAKIEEFAHQHESGPLVFRRRLHRETSFGAEYLPWEARLPDLLEVDVVAIEGPTRVTRSTEDFRSFVECLERLGVRLHSMAPLPHLDEDDPSS